MTTNLRPLIEARVREEIPNFKEVAGAADLANVMAGRLSDAGCYIFQERVTATESDLIGATMQRLAVSFAILIAVRNVKDARGGDAADASYLLQDLLKTALLGWSPDASADPLEYGGGALVSFTNGFFVWKDSFITHQFIRTGA
jgi:hypothetical protein